MATIFDLIADMETGDACEQDAYIEYAYRRITTSNIIYEQAAKNYELPDSGSFMCYTESADMGIPTRSAAAAGTACEAVNQELGAYLDALIETAKKVKASSEKNLKALIAIGKKVGVQISENFEGNFAAPLGKAVVNSGRLSLNAKKFMRSRQSCKVAKGFAKGMAYSLSAYGVSITGEMTAIAKDFGSVSDVRGSVETLKAVESRIADGGRAMGWVDAEKGVVDSVRAGDITDLAMAVYTTLNVADAVLKATGGSTKKNALAMIKSFCSDDGGNGKKITRTMDAINGDIKKYTENLKEVGTAATTGLTDSVYALMESIPG